GEPGRGGEDRAESPSSIAKRLEGEDAPRAPSQDSDEADHAERARDEPTPSGSSMILHPSPPELRPPDRGPAGPYDLSPIEGDGRSWTDSAVRPIQFMKMMIPPGLTGVSVAAMASQI